MEYVRTRESGRAAARYVINKWPTMFPHLKASKVCMHVGMILCCHSEGLHYPGGAVQTGGASGVRREIEM